MPFHLTQHIFFAYRLHRIDNTNSYSYSYKRKNIFHDGKLGEFAKNNFPTSPLRVWERIASEAGGSVLAKLPNEKHRHVTRGTDRLKSRKTRKFHILDRH